MNKVSNKYTETFKKEVIAFYSNNNLSIAKVEQKFKLGSTTLRTWLKVKKPIPSVGKKNYPIELKQSIVARVNKGENINKLAKEVGCCPTSVRGWMKNKELKNEELLLDELLPELSTMKKQIGETLLKEFDKYKSILTDAEKKLTVIVNELHKLDLVK